MTIRKEIYHSCTQENLLRLIQNQAEPYIQKYNVKLKRIGEYTFEGKVGLMGKGTVEITPEKLIVTIESPFISIVGANEKVEQTIERYAKEIIETCHKQKEQ